MPTLQRYCDLMARAHAAAAHPARGREESRRGGRHRRCPGTPRLRWCWRARRWRWERSTEAARRVRAGARRRSAQRGGSGDHARPGARAGQDGQARRGARRVPRAGAAHRSARHHRPPRLGAARGGARLDGGRGRGRRASHRRRPAASPGPGRPAQAQLDEAIAYLREARQRPPTQLAGDVLLSLALALDRAGVARRGRRHPRRGRSAPAPGCAPAPASAPRLPGRPRGPRRARRARRREARPRRRAEGVGELPRRPRRQGAVGGGGAARGSTR